MIGKTFHGVRHGYEKGEPAMEPQHEFLSTEREHPAGRGLSPYAHGVEGSYVGGVVGEVSGIGAERKKKPSATSSATGAGAAGQGARVSKIRTQPTGGSATAVGAAGQGSRMGTASKTKKSHKYDDGACADDDHRGKRRGKR